MSVAIEMSQSSNGGRSFKHVNDVLVEALRTYSDETLLRTADGTTFTGSQIETHIARYAAAFDRLGFVEGTRLAILAGNSVDVLFVQHGLGVTGGIYAPLHPMGTPADFAHVLTDAAIDVVVVDKAREHEIQTAVAIAGRDVRILTLGGNDEADLRVLTAAEDVTEIRLRQFDPEAICRIIFTGGTTGVPRATLISYRSMSAMYGIQIADWQWPDEVRHLLVAPMSHVGGAFFVPTIARGGRIDVEPGFDVVSTMAAIERHRITCIVLVPTMISAILEHPRLHEFDLSSLETVFYGASPITPARLRAAIAHFGPIFFQFYGQAEAPTTVTVLRREEHDTTSDQRLSSCGRPVADMAVQLVDGNGDVVPDGTPGELCVRGPLLMTGYFRKPEETAEAFRGGWLHTGDIAVRDAGDFLRIVDRAKDLVITGGFNVYPGVVEDVLEDHPAVAAASAFGVPDDYWGEALVAAVVLRDEEASPAELEAYVRERKGAVHTPKRIVVLDRIPLTAVGKPDKKELRRMFSQVATSPAPDGEST